METELPKIVASPTSVKGVEHDALTRDPNGDDFKYTSLRDILPLLPTTKGAATNPDRSFDSANISIKNQLVKQAASAYLQSAAILASRDENFLESIWENASRSTTLHSIWHKYVVNPLKACIGFVVTPICRIAACLANRICL